MKQADRDIIDLLQRIYDAQGGGGSVAFSAITGAAGDNASLAAALALKADITRGMPQNSKSADYTTVLADAQKHILHPLADDNARTFTLPDNASVAYPVGTMITFVNLINTITISITSDTLRLANDVATGNRTLAAGGIATAVKVDSAYWLISGVGLT